MSAKFKEGALTFRCEINWNPVFLSYHSSGIKQKKREKPKPNNSNKVLCLES